MQLVLATNNRNKRSEFAGMFGDHVIRGPADFGLEFDVEETGESFLANSLLKADHLRSLLQRAGRFPLDDDVAVIADDSGLCVDALGGGPGVYSARFGSPDGGATELDAKARNDLLLQSIGGTADRSARFVCCMVALLPDDRLIVAQESWSGRIADRPSAGTGGFGYDPIFYLPDRGCTAADLSASEKNRVSHRGRASRVLHAALLEAERLRG
ncbi:MAG: non-canonical purine NTP pyrophosphatase [Spirochaetota bacterium]